MREFYKNFKDTQLTNYPVSYVQPRSEAGYSSNAINFEKKCHLWAMDDQLIR
jgi:hypothetical protein